MKLYKSPLLIADIIKGAVSGIIQFLTTEKLWKLMTIFSYLIKLKALSSLKIFKFLSWFFGHVEKTVWLERKSKFENLWCHNLVNEELQHVYCPTSHEIKATRQWNLLR